MSSSRARASEPVRRVPGCSCRVEGCPPVGAAVHPAAAALRIFWGRGSSGVGSKVTFETISREVERESAKRNARARPPVPSSHLLWSFFLSFITLLYSFHRLIMLFFHHLPLLSLLPPSPYTWIHFFIFCVQIFVLGGFIFLFHVVFFIFSSTPLSLEMPRQLWARYYLCYRARDRERVWSLCTINLKHIH